MKSTIICSWLFHHMIIYAYEVKNVNNDPRIGESLFTIITSLEHAPYSPIELQKQSTPN